MDGASTWLAALREVAEPDLASAVAEDPALRDAVLDALSRARAAWPDLALEPPRFAAHLAARLHGEGLSPATIAALCASDLWLACACLHDVSGAHAELERRHAVDVRRGLAGLEAPEEMVAEVLVHLLVRGEQRPARLAEYSGRGNLGRWISVVTRRLAIDRLRGRSHEGEQLDDGAMAAAYGDPELAMLRGGTRDAFRAALEQAAAELEPRERNMLRYHFVHRLGLDEIAGIYRVSRSTARRRLAEVRELLTQRVRERLRQQLRVDDQQLDHELAELQSAVAVTLSRILRAPR